MIEQFPKKKYYLVIGRANIEVTPYGNFSFDWKYQQSNDLLYYRHELTGSMTFQNNDDNGTFDYDNIILYKSNIEVKLLVKKRCSGAYADYWSGYLDMLGEYDDSSGVATLNAIPNDEYTELIENNDKEYNIYDLGLTEQTNTDTSVVPNIDYDNGILLKDIIDYIILDLANIDYESEFFDAVINPVTVANPNRLNDLTLYSKSDIIDPTVNAIKGIVTLGAILTWCREIFNCFPSIDSTGKYRIENRKYYDFALSYTVEKTVGANTNLVTKENGKYIRNLNKYSYNSGMIYRKEIFRLDDTENSEFVETQILYDTSKIKENAKTYNISGMSTDLEYIQDKPDEINPKGFFLMSTNSGAVLISDIQYTQQARSLQLEAFSFDTFTASGTENILEADNSNDLGRVVIYNEVLGKLKVGDEIIVQGVMTLNSGVYPYVEIKDDALNTVISNTGSFIEGSNNIFITINTLSAKGRIEILNSAATNFELLNIVVIRNPRHNVKNGHLSWLNLLNAYWTYGRILLNGQVYGVDRVFDSTSKGKNGALIENVPMCCEAFDPIELVKTDIGNGTIISAKENKDGIFDFDLNYETE